MAVNERSPASCNGDAGLPILACKNLLRIRSDEDRLLKHGKGVLVRLGIFHRCVVRAGHAVDSRHLGVDETDAHFHARRTQRFDEINSTVGSLGATGRRGRFLRLLAERAKRFTGTQGLMEPLRTLRRTSAFTHTSALNVCFGGLA